MRRTANSKLVSSFKPDDLFAQWFLSIHVQPKKQQHSETFETFETPKNYQYLSQKRTLQSYLEIFSPAYHLSKFPAKTTSWSWKTMEKLKTLASKPGIEKTQKRVAKCFPNSWVLAFLRVLLGFFLLIPWYSLHLSIMTKNAQRYWHASRHKRSGWHTALLSTVPLKQTFYTERRHTFFSLKCFPRDQMPQNLLRKCSRCDLEIFFNA